jgi:hypothetical protein
LPHLIGLWLEKMTLKLLKYRKDKRPVGSRFPH